jgi:Ca2+-binding EF-hand superfamily protein
VAVLLPMLTAGVAGAQALLAVDASAGRAEPDALHGAVDPLNLPSLRRAFFAAAGPDNELTSGEFEAAKLRENKALRSFDHWKRLARHDRDHSGTIDWFELTDYRRSLRAELLKQHDADGDGRLAGDERDSALRALRTPGAETAKPRTSGDQAVDLSEFDTDGDGELSAAERQAAFDKIRQERRLRQLAQYDTDGDGKLSDEERAVMRKEMHAERKAEFREMFIRLFDADGDGELSESERAEQAAAGKKMGKFFEYLKMRHMDLDGDGEVTDDERDAQKRRWASVGLRMTLRIRAISDADGDGQVSLQEQAAAERKLTAGMRRWVETLAAQHDTNADGRFSAAERDQVLRGIQADIERRIAQVDDNANRILDPAEGMRLIEIWLAEHDVSAAPTAPHPTPHSDAADSRPGAAGRDTPVNR